MKKLIKYLTVELHILFATCGFTNLLSINYFGQVNRIGFIILCVALMFYGIYKSVYYFKKSEEDFNEGKFNNKSIKNLVYLHWLLPLSLLNFIICCKSFLAKFNQSMHMFFGLFIVTFIFSILLCVSYFLEKKKGNI